MRVGAGPLLEVLGLLPESTAESGAWDAISFKTGLYTPTAQDMSSLADSLVKCQPVSSCDIICLPEILLRE